MNETPNVNQDQSGAVVTSGHSRIGTAWVSLTAFIVILLLLAIFILQNSNQVRISFLGYAGNLSFGVAMLLAAIAGSALTLLIGSIRILQLRSQRKKLRSNQSQI